jgi:hypothetical protein
MKYTKLNEDDLQLHKTQLTQHILSNTHVLHGNPFLETVSTMFEEFGIWRPEFFESLQNVLQHTQATELIVVKYTHVDGELVFSKGNSVPATLDFKLYNDWGFELDFIGNGAENVFFDTSYSWCVGTVVDVHFVGALPEIMEIFYADEAVKSAKKMDFET